ncbi:MAG: hypothetical protein H6734_20190 [Alphaproteobacteria bacterium]|nr:hypothetical protein [Alphaproteobacteria bacterium]
MGLLGAGAILAILGLVVGLYFVFDEGRVPPGLDGVLVGSAIGSVVFTGLTALAWYKLKVPLKLVENDGQRFLEIYDRQPIVLAEPFRVAYAWTKVPAPKGPPMTLLVVGFYDDDGLALTLAEQWGAIYSPPADWPSGVLNGGPARATYMAAGRSFLVDLVPEVAGR